MGKRRPPCLHVRMVRILHRAGTPPISTPNTLPSVTLAQTPHPKRPRTDPDATGPRSLSPVASLPGGRCPLGAGTRREHWTRGAASYVTAVMVLVFSMSEMWLTLMQLGYSKITSHDFQLSCLFFVQN